MGPVDYVEPFAATPGPFRDLIESIVSTAHAPGEADVQFRQLQPVRSLLELCRPQQREALLALFREIGLVGERARSHRGTHIARTSWGAFIPLCLSVAILLKRDHKLTQADWLHIFTELGRFECIYVSFSHPYMPTLLGRLERDAKHWNEVPPSLLQAIRHVSELIGTSCSNMPEQKASERLVTIVRRFEARAALIEEVRSAIDGDSYDKAHTMLGEKLRSVLHRFTGKQVSGEGPQLPQLPAAPPQVRDEITSLLSNLRREVADMEVFRGHVFGGCPSFAVLCGLPADRFPELLRQVSARHDELVGPDGTMNTGGWATNPGCRERLALLEIIASHLPKAVEGRPDVLTYLCAWVASQNDPVQALDRIDEGVLRAVERHAKTNELTPPMTAWVMNCRERWVKHPKTYATRIKRSGALVSDELIIDLDAGEPWAARLLADVADATPAVRATWTHLIDHCMGSSGSAPSRKWSTRASELVKTIGKRDFEAAALRWLPLINEPRTTVATSGYYQLPIGSIQLLDRSMNTLRGLCWAVSLAPTPTNTTDIARALGQLVISAYRKIPRARPARHPRRQRGHPRARTDEGAGCPRPARDAPRESEVRRRPEDA